MAKAHLQIMGTNGKTLSSTVHNRAPACAPVRNTPPERLVATAKPITCTRCAYLLGDQYQSPAPGQGDQPASHDLAEMVATSADEALQLGPSAEPAAQGWPHGAGPHEEANARLAAAGLVIPPYVIRDMGVRLIELATVMQYATTP